jgi:hypothetical protein
MENDWRTGLYFQAADKLKHVFALRRFLRIGRPAFEINAFGAKRRLDF